MYAEIGRPDASRSGSPGVVACRIPRHSRSASSPPSPDASSSRDLRRHARVTPGDAGTVHGPARSARSGIHPSHGIFTAEMQTSLRRQRRRRLSDRRRPRGNGSTAVKAAAVAIPLFLFTILVLLGVAGATASVAAYSFLVAGPRGPAAGARRPRVHAADDRLRPDRSGPARAARRRPPRGRDLRRHPARPHRRDDLDRGQDVLGELGLRPGRLHRGRDRHDPGPRPRWLDDHPAARARAPAPVHCLRRQRLRAQGQGDHPVDPPDPGLSGRGRQAGDHREVPEPELLRQPELRRRGGRPQLLEQGPQGPHARADGDPRRDPPVADPVRPRQERGRGELQGREGPDPDASRGARRPARSSSAATSSST